MGFSEKSQKIIDYRVAHPHLPMPAVATKFGVKHQWVYVLCKRAGVQTAAEPYKGMVINLRNVPVDIVESVKIKAKGEGLTMRLKVIQLLDNYSKGIDKSQS